MEKKIIVIAGEPSGDLQASLLVAKIKELDDSFRVFAVGGEALAKAGAQIIQDIKGLSVLGLFDVVKKIAVFKKLMKFVLGKIEEIKPAAVILVDFSGFNLRVAKKINKRTKVIYYISPQVWASRQGRIETIRKYIDKMIVIFSFEKEFYQRFGIEAEFVGCPLLDIVKPSLGRDEALKKFGLSKGSPLFALLPGSRASEIKNILPVMLKSARLIKEKIPNAQFIISKPSSLESAIYQTILKAQKIEAKIIEAQQYDCLNAADFVIVTSGTATLETAIMGKPNVVIYKMGILNYLLYRPLVKIPFIGMENIVAGKLIAPEFIQFQAKPQELAAKVLEIFQDKARMAAFQKELTALKEKLGPPQAPLRAAQSILAFIGSA